MKKFSKLRLFPVIAAMFCGALLQEAPLAAQTDNPVRYDAEIYAREHDITVEEALQRFSLQSAVGEPAHLMEVNEAETFCGFWIQHQPYYTLVAAFTTDPETSRQVVEKYFPEATAASIEIRQYELTYKELHEIRKQTVDLMRSLGIEISGGGLDIVENGIKIMVPDLATFEAQVRQNQLVFHPSVTFIEGTIVLSVAESHATGFYPVLASIAAVAVGAAAWFVIRLRRRRGEA